MEETMKRIVSYLLSLVLLLGSCAYAENTDLAWGKSIGITRSDWTERYNTLPSAIVGDITQLNFVSIGTSNYRVNYIAEPTDNVTVLLVCEDTTDEIVMAGIIINLNDVKSYEDGKRIGKYIVEFAECAALATQPNITVDWISANIIPIINTSAIGNYSVKNDGIIYDFDYTKEQIIYGLKSSVTFESDDDFQEYRKSTGATD